MNEPRIVTPQEARLVLDRKPEHLVGVEPRGYVARLAYTVATEPERVRSAEFDAWALGHAAGIESVNQWSRGNIQHDGTNPYRVGNEASDPIRAAVVKALRDAADESLTAADWLRRRAQAYKKGAPL